MGVGAVCKVWVNSLIIVRWFGRGQREGGPS